MMVWGRKTWGDGVMDLFFFSAAVKCLGVKMVLSGEGADEMFGGYLYFHKSAPFAVHTGKLR